MSLREHALITLDHRRRAVAQGRCLPRLLERRLQLHDDHRSCSPRIRPVHHALVEEVARPNPDSSKSLEQATKDIITFIDSNKNEIARGLLAMRSREIVENLYQLSTASLIEKIFKWFDQYVFMDTLMGRVKFKGNAIGPTGTKLLNLNDAGKTIAVLDDENRAWVLLNCRSLQHMFEIREVHEAMDIIIVAVAHQLIHAYFIVACGSQETPKKSHELLTHGEHFGIVMYRIKNAADGLPLDFGNTMPEVARWAGSRLKASDTGGVTLVSHKWADDRKITTECARNISSIKEESCKDWYKGKCLKVLDPDVYVYSAASRSFEEKATSKCGPKADWVEVCHKKDPYKVARKTVDTFPSLKKKFEDSKRKLEIESVFRKEIVQELICFLHEGDLYSANHLSLKAMIELYQVAMSIKFEELKDRYLIDALFAATSPEAGFILDETDVVDAIQQVYKSKISPDKSLRDWVKHLIKTPGSVAMRIVETDPRIMSLRQQNLSFRQDYNEVIRSMKVGALASGRTTLPLMSGGLQRTITASPTIGRTLSPTGLVSSYTVNPTSTVIQNPGIQFTTTATQIPNPAITSAPGDYYTPVQYPQRVITDRYTASSWLERDECVDEDPYVASILLSRRTRRQQSRLMDDDDWPHLHNAWDF